MTDSITVTHALITRLSPAKINLFLHVTGKRADGYHNLQTVFRLLDWGDYLHFLPAQLLLISTTDSDLEATITSSIKINNDGRNDFDNAVNNDAQPIPEVLCASEVVLPTLNPITHQQAATLCAQLLTLDGAETITDSLADNLIIKAARALLAYAIPLGRLPARLHHVSITLDKRLPMGAGLGGGSSNAATALLVLNELWQLDFSNMQLRTIGATLGADVPIFIFGQDAIAMGIGEQLTAIHVPNQQYLLLTPNAHINTAQLFAHPELQRNTTPLSAATIRDQSSHYIQTLRAPYNNVFAPVVESLAPAVAQALQYLRGLEPQALGVARMTGSGSAVFLPLDAHLMNETALLSDWITNAPCPAYVVNNLQKSM
ncbi:4-diphosphocytidyl-2-C-methyl-D-erythritol kinase [Psychrobacter sp. PL15]|uniref:4-(cytidine 5'-diphospho)-2-C-methyl-D-erythritol kinase n=1 Tax=Psychrobacter sp. PL15 TaxID=3071719 RepID=UPI002E0243FB|nr:4-diphosphocytidyl-2-C-methyl-D-erythritol kinase [Psychrobacter sp. PL15]